MDFERSTDSQIHQKSSQELGGKGFQLAQLRKNGFDIPPFLVLMSGWVNQVLKKINPDLSKITKETPKESLVSALADIRLAIENYTFSESESREILNEFDAFFDVDSMISVRSSGAAEDGLSTSFAGQHSTFLYVRREEVLDRIKACMASAWEFGVISYRIKHGISLKEMDFAIVLQKMIFATKSGVGFSMNPSGNLTDAIVVAGYGVGEGIVSDQVESDTFEINRQTGKVSSIISKKRYALTYSEEEGMHKALVPQSLAEIPCLSDGELNLVKDAVFKAEKMLRSVADIEFCFDENGRLFLLQARPVTSIDLSQLKILDNTNIVESYPGISLPLTFSFARYAYEKAFQGASKAFWVSQESLAKTDDLFYDLLGYHQGRIYYRLDNWYKMISLVFSSKRSIESWEKAVGLKRPSSNEVSLSFGNKLKVYASTIWRILNYKRGNRQFFKLFNEHYSTLRAIDLGTLTLEDLSNTLDQSASSFFEFWYLTLINDLMTFKSFDWVQKGIKRRNLGSEELANDLIAGIHQSESEISIREVLKLKETIQNHSELGKLFNRNSKEIWEVISSEDLDGFSNRIKQHIDRFGDRTLAELKLENPSFRQEPWRFIDLLKGQLQSNVNLIDFQQKQKDQIQRSKALIQSNCKWWNPRSYFFKYAIRTAAYGTRNREDMRFCRTRIYGAVKDIYLEIGKRFEERKLIVDQKDIFYLTSEEIRELCSGGIMNLEELVVKRKSVIERDEKAELPDRIIYTNEPPIFESKERSADHSGFELTGIAVSKGIVRAEAIVISNPSYDLDVSGKILITEITDPGWVFLMSQAAGLISEKGSLLSHTAIVGREMGIPVVVNVEGVTRKIQTGDVIEMDGARGTVRILESE